MHNKEKHILKIISPSNYQKKKNPIFFITSKFKGKKKKKITWTCNNSSETSPTNPLSNIFSCGRR